MECAKQHNNLWNFKPIGFIKSVFHFKNGTPRQPSLCSFARGSLTIPKSVYNNPEHSLEGIEEFSYVWLIFVFHMDNGSHSKAKVKPPRLNGKRVGVFSTRSPHRANPIGLSLVRLEEVKGDTLFLSGLDLLEGTPVLDVKPYIPDYDCPATSSCPHTLSPLSPLSQEPKTAAETESSRSPPGGGEQQKDGGTESPPTALSLRCCNSGKDSSSRRDKDLEKSPDSENEDALPYSTSAATKGDDSEHSLEVEEVENMDGGLDPGTCQALNSICHSNPYSHDARDPPDNLGTEIFYHRPSRSECSGCFVSPSVPLKSATNCSQPGRVGLEDSECLMSNVASSKRLQVQDEQGSCCHSAEESWQAQEFNNEAESVEKTDRELGNLQNAGICNTGKARESEGALEFVSKAEPLEEVSSRRTTDACSTEEEGRSLRSPGTREATPSTLTSRDAVSVAKWLQRPPVSRLSVRFTERALERLSRFSPTSSDPDYRLRQLAGPGALEEGIRQVLREDPRSTYRRQHCQDRLYFFCLDSAHVTCWFDQDEAEVVRILPLCQAAAASSAIPLKT